MCTNITFNFSRPGCKGASAPGTSEVAASERPRPYHEYKKEQNAEGRHPLAVCRGLAKESH